MDQFQEQVKKMLELAGFNEPSVKVDPETRKAEIFLNEGEWFKKWLPGVVNDVDHILRLMVRKAGLETLFVDINNYRKERERLIVEIAKAAAKKAITQKETVKLPAMNAYERRLIHVELAIHPDVKTESEGEGKTRCVVIRPI